jgi:hypothetical protein
MSEEGKRAVVPIGFVLGLLDTIEKPMIVAERGGNVLLVNTHAKQFLESQGYSATPSLNLFNEFLRVDARKILGAIDRGEQKVDVQIQGGAEKPSRESNGCASRSGWWWRLKTNRQRSRGRILQRN